MKYDPDSQKLNNNRCDGSFNCLLHSCNNYRYACATTNIVLLHAIWNCDKFGKNHSCKLASMCLIHSCWIDYVHCSLCRRYTMYIYVPMQGFILCKLRTLFAFDTCKLHCHWIKHYWKHNIKIKMFIYENHNQTATKSTTAVTFGC